MISNCASILMRGNVFFNLKAYNGKLRNLKPFVITFFLYKQVNVMIHCTITGEGVLNFGICLALKVFE